MVLRVPNALAILQAHGPEPIAESDLVYLTEFLDLSHELNSAHAALLDRGEMTLEQHVGLIERTMWMLRVWHDELPSAGFDETLARMEPAWAALKGRLVAHYRKHGFAFEIRAGKAVLTPIEGGGA